MNNGLPKSPNPNATEDVEEGRQMVSDADSWLEEMDHVLQDNEVKR